MSEASLGPPVLRFGGFEVDLHSGELRKNALKVKLQEQPFRILAMLLERPGEVITREELQKKLWSDGTFVDFEHSLATAVKKLREALGDSADNPRFVETLPRRGYRFIAPVVGADGVPPDVAGEDTRRLPLRKHWIVATTGVLVAVVGVLLAVYVAGLRDRIVGPGLAPARPTQGSALPKIESIAVLPLENLSGDPEQEYFADGMTDELIATLAKVGSLRVISRTSVMQYKRVKKPLPQIARELNVDAVVEGTVLRSGDRVRITAQVVYAPTDRHLWAESYERDLRDVLALQSDVARAIVGEIRIKVTPQEQTRVARVRQVNPVAYDAYLRARHHWLRWTGDGMIKSIEYLRQANAEDPGYAPAYAAMAEAYCLRAMGYAPVTAREAYSEARKAALKALELDDGLSEAHNSLAVVKWNFEWDWVGAEREFKRALELNPGDGNAHRWYGMYLATQEHQAEALAEFKRALELDPLSPDKTMMVGWGYGARQYDQQIYYFRKALELDPNFALAHHNLGCVYIGQGRYEEALQEVRRGIALGGENDPYKSAVLAIIYAKSGQRAKALKILAQFEERWKHDHLSAGLIAGIHIRLGNKEQALAWLQKAYQDRDPALVSLKLCTEYEPVRSDPRFQDLLRRMNFPP